MNAKAFFDIVSLMRTEQKLYFQTRDKAHLQESKRLEREVDQEIARVREILGDDSTQAAKPQNSLFQ